MNDDIRTRLAAPIEGFSWRMQQANNQKVGGKYPPGTRGLFMAYIDARDLYDRLDDVFGVGGWSRKIVAVNADGSVTGRLTVRINDPASLDVTWVEHEDIGYSNDPGAAHEKEPLKAAASDAFKRAGVGLGIGRFLYELEPVWREVDQWGKPLQPIVTPERPPRSTFIDQLAGGLANVVQHAGADPRESVDILAKSLGVPVGQPTLAQQVRREPPVRQENKGEPTDQPCDVPGCDLTCAGKFVGYSQRTYGLNLCGKHSKRAKDGEMNLDQVRMDIANNPHERQEPRRASNGLDPLSLDHNAVIADLGGWKSSLNSTDRVEAWNAFWRLVRPMGYANLQDVARLVKTPLDGLADYPPQTLYDMILEAKA